MKNFLRISEAADYLGVSRTSVIRFVESGRLKSEITPGGQRIFRKENLDEFSGRAPQRNSVVFYVRDSGGNQELLDSQTEKLTKIWGTLKKSIQIKLLGLMKIVGVLSLS